MSGVDRAWLLMDRAANPMLIIGLIVLDGALRRERLRTLLAERFLCFGRFRCMPVSDALGGRWVPFTQFQLDDHIQCLALPRAAGQDQLEALVGELAGTPLNPNRPLWSFHLISGYGQGSALIVRIHHSYADGVALLQVLLRLCQPSARARIRAPAAAAALSAADGSGGASATIGAAFRSGVELLEKGMHYGLHPLEAGAAVRPLASLSAELARLGLMADDPPTRLKRALSGVKRVAWAQPLALEEVHIISRVLGCTVNDVLVSVLAGALGSYLKAQGEQVEGLTLRAVVPVNLRALSDPAASLGNDFGLVFVQLPVGIRHPLERLYAVRSAMQQLKASPQALITLGLLATVGYVPALEEPALALLGAKASLVASNLPGPTQALRLGGATVSQLLFWVPQAGGIGTGVSMLTYRGQVQLGVMADRALIEQPGELVAAMGVEFERLVYLVLLGAGSLGD